MPLRDLPPFAQLTLVNVSPARWRHRVTAERQIIGRSSDAEICVGEDFDAVSRRHAVVWFESRRFWIYDMASRGGTSVNGVWIAPEKPVQIVFEDRIALANVELHFSGERQPANDACRDTLVDLDLRDQKPHSTALREIPFTSALRRQLAALTPAELRILLWMRRGLVADEEIAKKVHRSVNTVRTQVACIFSKLSVNSRSELLGLLNRSVFDSADWKPHPSSGT